jgi:hypothetical protein
VLLLVGIGSNEVVLERKGIGDLGMLGIESLLMSEEGILGELVGQGPEEL